MFGTIVKAAAVAAVASLTLTGGAAQAALADLTTGAPVFSGTFSVVEGYDDVFGYAYGDFWGDLEDGAWFSAYGDSTPYGSLDIIDGVGDSAVYADLDGYEWADDVLYGLFTANGGAMMDAFGSGLLATWSDFVWQEDEGLWTGSVSFAAVLEDTAPVPLPATLPLLLVALAAPAALRRRR